MTKRGRTRWGGLRAWAWLLGLAVGCGEGDEGAGAEGGGGAGAGAEAEAEASELAVCTPERAQGVLAENQQFAGETPLQEACRAVFETLDGTRVAVAERDAVRGTATRIEVDFDHGRILAVDGVPCESVTPEGLAGTGDDCDQRYVCGCCPFELLKDELATERWAVAHPMAFCGGHEAGGYRNRTEASSVYGGTKFYGGSEEVIPERPSGSSDACLRCTRACRGLPGCSCCSKCGAPGGSCFN